MLVVSRKECQRIFIGDKIVITIVKVRGKVVRIGVDAPREMPVLRDELEARLVAPEVKLDLREELEPGDGATARPLSAMLAKVRTKSRRPRHRRAL